MAEARGGGEEGWRGWRASISENHSGEHNKFRAECERHFLGSTRPRPPPQPRNIQHNRYQHNRFNGFHIIINTTRTQYGIYKRKVEIFSICGWVPCCCWCAPSSASGGAEFGGGGARVLASSFVRRVFSFLFVSKLRFVWFTFHFHSACVSITLVGFTEWALLCVERSARNQHKIELARVWGTGKWANWLALHRIWPRHVLLLLFMLLLARIAHILTNDKRARWVYYRHLFSREFAMKIHISAKNYIQLFCIFVLDANGKKLCCNFVVGRACFANM